MKLKQILGLFFASLFIFFLTSCEKDETEISLENFHDAQIYGFRLKAKPISSIDTANYAVMAKTKFSIDQFRGLIYNADSLPYQTKLRKFLTTVDLGTYGVSKTRLIYRDSTVVWEEMTDSIDFSVPSYPKIELVALDGITTKTYSIDIRIHQVNPDLLVWNNMTSLLNQPTTITKQKTLLKEEMTLKEVFYTFSEDKDGKLYLYKANKGEAYSAKQPIQGLPLTANIDNITLFNGVFYTVDSNNKGYSSKSGIEWAAKGNNIYSILGVLPATEANNDSLLVITDIAGEYSFAKTTDLNKLVPVRSFNNIEKSTFPMSGFSATTNFDRTNPNKNLLILTGGKTLSGDYKGMTWLIQISEGNTLRITDNQGYNLFENKEGIPTFLYNGFLYALTSNKLYRSVSFGYKWMSPSSLEALDSDIPLSYKQSVIIDKENYMWIFGGVSLTSNQPLHQVWRGRLNKLNPQR